MKLAAQGEVVEHAVGAKGREGIGESMGVLGL
jgi:hypothetical protein